jgi:non-specific serine/threonine protein kinase
VLADDLVHRLVTAFGRGAGHGLLQLGAGEVGTALPPVLGYWRELGARYVTAVCAQPDIEERRTKTDRPDLPAEEQAAFAGAAPPMTGAEYLRLGDRAPLG